ncbi:hypothetical protein ACWGNN_01010 [Streptomyces sp. NPDC055817]
MRRHIGGIAAAGLLLAGCSGAHDSGDAKPDKPKTSASRSSSATVKLSDEWIPKLDKATDGKGEAVCGSVGTQQCADHLTKIATTVFDLESAIEEADAKSDYPRSMAEIKKVDKATDAWTEHQCLNDPNADMDGSPCPKDAYDILGAGAGLQMTLITDELKR